MNLDQKKRLIPRIAEIIDILESVGLLTEEDAVFVSLADACNAISNMCEEIKEESRKRRVAK